MIGFLDLFKNKSFGSGGVVNSDIDMLRIEQGFSDLIMESGGQLTDDMRMVKTDLLMLSEYAKKISDLVNDEKEIEAWVVAKLSKVEQTTANANHYLKTLEYESGGEVKHNSANTIRMMCLHIGTYAEKMLISVDSGVDFESWMKHELAIAADIIDSLFHYLDYFYSGNHLENGGVIYPNKMSYGGSVSKQYEPIKGTSYEIKTEIYYNKGGMNYFTGRNESRGYYLSVMPVVINRFDNGLVSESYTAFSGVKKLLLEVAKKSDKSAKEAERLAASQIQELKEYILRQMKSKGEIPEEQVPVETPENPFVEEQKIEEQPEMESSSIEIVEENETKKYQLGDLFSKDFDYVGMLEMALQVTENWRLDDLQKLYDSMNAVFYYGLNAHLSKIMVAKENDNKGMSKAYALIYRKKVKEVIDEMEKESERAFAKGGTLRQRKKVGKVMQEYKSGKLKTHGRVVKDRNQAIAIALSEADLSRKEKGGHFFNDKELLRKYKRGEDIGFTAIAHLKSKGLIPRADGKKRVSEKYTKKEQGGSFQSYYVVVKLPKGLKRKNDFDGFDKNEIISWCEDKGWVYNKKGETLGGRVLKEYEFFVKQNTKQNIHLPKSKKLSEGGIIEEFQLPATDFVPINSGGIPSSNTPSDHWALYY